MKKADIIAEVHRHPCYDFYKHNERKSLILRLLDYHKRVRQLIALGWYRNMAGGFTESHCMCVISKKDLFNMTEHEFGRISGRK